MTVVAQANWWCSTCGGRGSGNGEAYAAWLRGHTCGLSAPTMPAVAKPSNWAKVVPNSTSSLIGGQDIVKRHQTVPGLMTFTVLEKRSK